MQKLSAPKLTDVLPESLLYDEKFVALAKALEAELESLSAQIIKTLHLPRLDELSGAVLDLLAWQFHVDFYEPIGLSDETKRNLIRSSIEVHRLKGTVAAVKKVNAAFNRDVVITEWFQYGGAPYHFKVSMRDNSGVNRSEDWTRQLEDAKNVRSWCDDIGELKNRDAPAYVGIYARSVAKAYFPLANDVKLYVGVANLTYAKSTFPVLRDDRDVHLYIAALYTERTRTKFLFDIKYNMPGIPTYLASVWATRIKSVIPVIIKGDFVPSFDVYTAGVQSVKARAAFQNFTTESEIPRLHTLTINSTYLSVTGGGGTGTYYSISDNDDGEVSLVQSSGFGASISSNYISFSTSTSNTGTYSCVFKLKYKDGNYYESLTNTVTVTLVINEYVEVLYANSYSNSNSSQINLYVGSAREKKYTLRLSGTSAGTYFASGVSQKRVDVVWQGRTYHLYSNGTWS